MKKASQEAKGTKNFHNRIGYVAFYMEALIKNGLSKNAEQYDDSFLKAYSKEIFQYRWHLFFSVYLEALFHQGRFEKILKTYHSCRLGERDKTYQMNANYLPIIPIYSAASKFAEGNISKERFFEKLDAFHVDYDFQSNRTLRHMLKGMKIRVPELSEKWDI